MMTRSALMTAAALAASAIGLGGSACAMNAASGPAIGCAVEGAEILPAEIGGQQAVCAAMQRALIPALQEAGIAPSAVSVSVHVRSPYRISAIPSVNGNKLAEQNVGISDRQLNPRSINMLAMAVAAEVGKVRD